MGKLYRSDDKVIGGVCAGLAEYFGLDVKLVRLAWVVFVLLGGSGLLFYVILWLIMPLKNGKNYAERMRDRLGK